MGVKPVADSASPHFEVPDRALRIPETCRISGLSNATLWRMEKEGLFPKRRRLSNSASGHLLSEVLEWLRSRPAAD